jgi:hypothetical protein
MYFSLSAKTPLYKPLASSPASHISAAQHKPLVPKHATHREGGSFTAKLVKAELSTFGYKIYSLLF